MKKHLILVCISINCAFGDVDFHNNENFEEENTETLLINIKNNLEVLDLNTTNLSEPDKREILKKINQSILERTGGDRGGD